MTGSGKDHWSSEAYQNAASFVPKLAGKIVQWLDPQKNDAILDIGCGDGVLDLQIAQILSQGTGKIHGIDASPAMIEAANKATAADATSAVREKCTFETLDALSLPQTPHLQTAAFDKAFSNAAMHWILRRPLPGTDNNNTNEEDFRAAFFRGVRDALVPHGTFAFEMGGLGNVGEIRGVILAAVARRLATTPSFALPAPGAAAAAANFDAGLARAMEADPWFFPDEEWARRMLEDTVGGWKVERVEREYRPTPADAGGVEGWVRLMGAQFFEAIGDVRERAECIEECVKVLEVVCGNPPGREGWTFGYVRLRILARKM